LSLVARSALLERKGAKHAFVVTKGFRDLLRINNQSRPSTSSSPSFDSPRTSWH